MVSYQWHGTTHANIYWPPLITRVWNQTRGVPTPHITTRRPESPPTKQPTINGTMYMKWTTIRYFLVSTTEGELGNSFVKCQHGTALWIYLTKMGHQKPPTPLITDSETLYGFVNGNICQHRSRAIAMRLHCSRNRVRQGHYLVYWSRGKKTSQLLHQTPCNQKST